MIDSDVTQPATMEAAENRRIIVIDDSAANVIFVKAILSKAGFEVYTANNGFEGLAVLREQPADLVFLDLSMPDIDGFNVLDRLYAEGEGPNLETRIVALTAHAIPDMLRERGFDGYVAKPIKPDELVAVANDFLNEK